MGRSGSGERGRTLLRTLNCHVILTRPRAPQEHAAYALRLAQRDQQRAAPHEGSVLARRRVDAQAARRSRRRLSADHRPPPAPQARRTPRVAVCAGVMPRAGRAPRLDEQARPASQRASAAPCRGSSRASPSLRWARRRRPARRSRVAKRGTGVPSSRRTPHRPPRARSASPWPRRVACRDDEVDSTTEDEDAAASASDAPRPRGTSNRPCMRAPRTPRPRRGPVGGRRRAAPGTAPGASVAVVSDRGATSHPDARPAARARDAARSPGVGVVRRPREVGR